MLFEEFGDAGFLDFSFVLAIDFVADENEGEFFRLLGGPLVEELGYPRLDIVEGLDQSERTRLFVIS
jgi:hypothetical protein